MVKEGSVGMDGNQWHKDRATAERLLVALSQASPVVLKTLQDAELTRVGELLVEVSSATLQERQVREKSQKK